MKILKKNQLIVLVISLILVTAGYLNYNSIQDKKENIMTSQTTANLGDATLVNSNAISNNETENQIEESKEETKKNQLNKEEQKETDIEVVSKKVTDDSYFVTSKLERESMYSQMLETYQNIYNNPSATAEQKNTAIDEIGKINQLKNAIMISENLIKTKGIEDLVIFANKQSVSVIIKSEELAQDKVAQIQNIISRELNVSADTIHISKK